MYFVFLPRFIIKSQNEKKEKNSTHAIVIFQEVEENLFIDIQLLLYVH